MKVVAQREGNDWYLCRSAQVRNAKLEVTGQVSWLLHSAGEYSQHPSWSVQDAHRLTKLGEIAGRRIHADGQCSKRAEEGQGAESLAFHQAVAIQ